MSRSRRHAEGGAGALVGRDRGVRMAQLQRARILRAMVELVREYGASNVTVAHIVTRSGVSRRTFYDLFADREACFLATFDDALAQIAERIVPAYSAGGVWSERLRAALAALLELFDQDPAIGALCVVDALAGGAQALSRRAATIELLVDAVHEGRNERAAARRGARQSPGRRPSRLVAEGVVGAVLSVLHGRLLSPEPEPLARLLSPLMAMVVLPYLGPDAAEHELALPARRTRRAARRDGRPDPLRELDMRLTHRTVCVLLAVAGQPAASSREVADASGVSDQGQMSKLLWRLEHLGLIVNGTARPRRGEPNAWTLTARGREVERAIRARTGG